MPMTDQWEKIFIIMYLKVWMDKIEKIRRRNKALNSCDKFFHSYNNNIINIGFSFYFILLFLF